MNDLKISKHEKLVKFVNELEGSKTFPVLQEELNASEIHTKIKPETIIHATVTLTDLLGIGAGSSGEFDLYELLQAYLTKPECRVQMNGVASRALHKSKITHAAS